MTNPKVFLIIGALIVFTFIAGSFILPGIGGNTAQNDGIPQQMGELPDAPVTALDAQGTPVAQPTQQAVIKRYEKAPDLTIDVSKRYVANVTTDQGNMRIELDPSQAPQAVNSFVFLAREGYYNNNPAIIGKQPNGSVFSAAFGDPTGTGNLRPGFTTPRETTTGAFVKGAVGMGDSQNSTNDGRFWISYADEPALNGRYTIFGKVTSGAEVLDKLSSGGKILSVTVEEL